MKDKNGVLVFKVNGIEVYGRYERKQCKLNATQSLHVQHQESHDDKEQQPWQEH